MGKELTISQLTFVDLYDSYTLSLSSDVIAVTCNSDGEALSTAEYAIEYSVRAGENNIDAKCKSASLSTNINGIKINSTTDGKMLVTINSTTKIPEDAGIYITIQTTDGNQFEFTRFISFMAVKNGKDGSPGRSITQVINWYLATSQDKNVTHSTNGWKTDVQNVNATDKYLWNYEEVEYSTGNPDRTDPCIIGVYGEGHDGKGIASIKEWYATNNSDSVAPNSGWSTTVKVPTSTERYLWNYEIIYYTDNSSEETGRRVIGVHGKDGESGVGFKVHPDKGNVFKDGIEEIILSLELNVGGDKINDIVTYEWSYYDFESDNESDRWKTLGTENYATYTAYSVSADGHTAFIYNAGDLSIQNIQSVKVDGQLRSDYEVVFAGSGVNLVVFDSPISTSSTVVVVVSGNSDYVEDISLVVKKTDSYAYSMFKCEITYNGHTYTDYETLMQDSQDIYMAETRLLDDGNLADGNCAILYTELYKNGKVVDPILTTNIYFFNNLSINDSVGYFDTTDTQGLPSGSNGDYAYFLTYKTMLYFQYVYDSADGEYVYDGVNTMLEKDPTVSGDTYSSQWYDQNNNAYTYQLILVQYDSGHWRPCNPCDLYKYCYINNDIDKITNVTFLNSKIIAIDKRKLSMLRELNVSVYQKVRNNSIMQFKYYVPFKIDTTTFTVYDHWKIYDYILNSDAYITTANSSTFQAIKTTYIEECFERKSDGVYINQVETTIDNTGTTSVKTPFYVKISSTEMGFYAQSYTDDGVKVGDPAKMVYVGNSSTGLKNAVLEDKTTVEGEASFKKNANFQGDVMFVSIDDEDETVINGQFVWKFEDNGSLSLTI